MCVTSEIQMEVAGEMQQMKTSSCDKSNMCDGMDKGYYKIEDGSCATMPGDQGQRIYCSHATPADGAIPGYVNCPKVTLQVNPTPAPETPAVANKNGIDVVLKYTPAPTSSS